MSNQANSQPTAFTQNSGPWLGLLCFLLASIFPFQIVSAIERHLPSAEDRFSGKQGEILWIEVPVNSPQANVTGTLLKRKIPFFRITDTRFAAIVGIDMQDPPGVQELRITVQTMDQTDHLIYSVKIAKEEYAVQHLKLPKNKVDLDSKTLKRVRLEQKEMAKRLSPRWHTPTMGWSLS